MKEIYGVYSIKAELGCLGNWYWCSSHKMGSGYVRASITADYREKAKRIVRKMGYSTKHLYAKVDIGDKLVEFFKRENNEPVLAIFFHF